MRRLHARHAGDATFAVGSKPQASQDVLVMQLWKLSQQLRLAHSASEITEHIADGDPGAPNHRLPEPNLWIEDDSVAIVTRGRHG